MLKHCRPDILARGHLSLLHRYINLLTRRNQFYSAQRVLREVRQARGINGGVQTIRNRLHDSGLRARRPNVVPVLTQRHRQARLQWAREHRGRTLNQWSRVLFSDESRFTVDHNDGRIRVWRRRGERFHHQFAVAHNRWGAGSVMIWAGISSEYRTDLHIVQGNVNGQYYPDNMLAPIVVPLATRQNPNFLFMNDNVSVYWVWLVQNALIQNNVVRMEWPTLSPDINCIENLWSILGGRILVITLLQQSRSWQVPSSRSGRPWTRRLSGTLSEQWGGVVLNASITMEPLHHSDLWY